MSLRPGADAGDPSGGSLPLVALIGLTGSGKSSFARMLERDGKAVRVRRLTTRPARADDDPAEIEAGTQIQPAEGDVVFPGWGTDQYCVPASGVRAARAAGRIPIVELGEFAAALAMRRAFPPTVIVVIERSAISPDSRRRLYLQRNMAEAEVAMRLESLETDARELHKLRERADWIIGNDGAIADLEGIASELLSKL